MGALLDHGLLPLAAALMLVDLVLIFFWVPTEVNLGISQRIFYFHVPIAWVAFLAFLVVFVASVMHLRRSSQRWDALAHSAAEVGVLFASLILITGILWAKPVWGVWWRWDPRLSSSLILWLIYVGYLMVRAYAPTPAQGARYSAVVGIFGFVDVPLVYFATRWWRTQHPEPLLGPGSQGGSLEGSMQFVLVFSLITFTVFFVYLLRQRFALRRSEDTVERIRESVQEVAH